METIVDRIRALCLKNHTSITKIESELGFANGTIGKWAKGKRKPPLEKVMAIAKRLNTTEDYLYYGEKETPPTPEGEGLSDREQLILQICRSVPESRQELLISLLLSTADTLKKFPELSLEDLRKLI